MIFLTFYGNERWQPATPAEEAAQGEVAHAATAEDLADSDPSPTVSYGTPVVAPHSEHPPHESPWIMVLPILALAGLAAVAGFLNMPFKSIEWFDDWLEPSFRRVPDRRAVVVRPGLDARSRVGGARAHRHHASPTASTAGVSRARRKSRSTRSSAPIAPVLGHAYYYDDTVSKLVDGPGRGFASFLDRVVDQKIIDGTVDGIGGLVKRAALGLRHVQDGLVRRYALGIAFGAVALLLYLVMRAG